MIKLSISTTAPAPHGTFWTQDMKNLTFVQMSEKLRQTHLSTRVHSNESKIWPRSNKWILKLKYLSNRPCVQSRSFTNIMRKMCIAQGIILDTNLKLHHSCIFLKSLETVQICIISLSMNLPILLDHTTKLPTNLTRHFVLRCVLARCAWKVKLKHFCTTSKISANYKKTGSSL